VFLALLLTCQQVLGLENKKKEALSINGEYLHPFSAVFGLFPLLAH